MRIPTISTLGLLLLAASCASPTPAALPPASPDAMAPAAPVTPMPGASAYDGVYKGMMTLTKNGSRCYSQSGPVTIRVRSNAFRTRWGSGWLDNSIAPDGTVSGSLAHAHLMGTVVGSHMEYTLGSEQCAVTISADKR